MNNGCVGGLIIIGEENEKCMSGSSSGQDHLHSPHINAFEKGMNPYLLLQGQKYDGRCLFT